MGEPPINLIHADELAKRMGYASANSSFREWAASLRITPVPGRRGLYDPVLVRRRLDEAQGLLMTMPNTPDRPLTHVEKRRARRGAA